MKNDKNANKTFDISHKPRLSNVAPDKLREMADVEYS